MNIDFVSVIWYNIHMKNTYRIKNHIISMVNYHFVFCPRYRRKIFQIDGVEIKFKEIVHQICEQNNIEILSLKCGIDYCHIIVNSPPELSPSDIMRLIKFNTGAILRKEFSAFVKTQNMWTRNYLVSTSENIPPDIIRQYVNSQKMRS